MGLLLTAIAVQFVLNGLSDVGVIKEPKSLPWDFSWAGDQQLLDTGGATTFCRQ